MLGLKIEPKYAEKAKNEILKKNLLEKYEPIKEKDAVIFPIKEKSDFSFPHKYVNKKFKSYKETPNLRDSLKKHLTKKELKSLISSYDTLGNIAILQIPEQLKKKESIIANNLLKTNKNLETICKVISPHQGLFRIQKIKPIAGKKTTICKYKESKALFVFDLNTTFFSPRLSTERLRISKLIKKGEIVGAFFAGVGPFPIVFAKNSKIKKAIAIELNPEAFKAMQENIVLNKVQDKVEAICGDVREKAKTMKFNRIVMPSPHTSDTFLDITKQCSKKGTIIHYYTFAPAKNSYSKALKDIKKEFKKLKILRKAKVRSFSPSKIQIVIDFKVL